MGRIPRIEEKASGPVKMRLNRLQNAIAAANEDLRKLEDPVQFRTFGELLLCHLGQLKHCGMEASRHSVNRKSASPIITLPWFLGHGSC